LEAKRKSAGSSIDHFYPSVSIIVPTFNRAHLLGRAIQSLLNQTYQNFEVIVVDDCSSDNTEKLVKSFRDERIRYLRLDKHEGSWVARNTGIKLARASYIAFQDSDDEWLPRKLERQMKEFEVASPNLGVVYSSYWLINKGEKTYYPPLIGVITTDGNIHRSLLRINFVGTPTAVVKKECLDKVGGFEKLPRLQEWDLWLRVSAQYEFKHIDEPLVNAYTQSDSISCDRAALVVARKYVLAKYFNEISKERDVLKRHYFEIGTILCFERNVKEGRRYFFKAIRANPFDSKLFLTTLTSFLGFNFYSKIADGYFRIRK
jgi:glycosyltransferase involved in cell wall biosynthesis